MLIRTSKTDTNILRSLFRKIDGIKLKKEEFKLLKHFNTIFITSEREKSILISNGINNKIIEIPNGADVSKFARDYPKDTASPLADIIFIGTSQYYPNQVPDQGRYDLPFEAETLHSTRKHM